MKVSPIPLRFLLVAGLACHAADRSGGDDGAWRTTTIQAGDTTVVRTSDVNAEAARLELIPEKTIGSADGADNYSFGNIREFAVGDEGDVFIFDRQFVQLRRYDTSGVFVRVIGGRGSGPGEYERVNGIAVHDDGRIVLWNAGSASVDVFSPEMEHAGSWTVPGGSGFNTSNAISVDTAGNTYVRTRVGDPPPDDNMARTGRMFGITGLLRYGRDGRIRDSLRPPDVVLDAARLVASVEGNTTMTGVPFSPQFYWSFSPLGAFVSGRGDIYALDISTLDGKVTRIEMAGDRPPVTAAEREENELVITASMRQTDPNWKWNGAPIPSEKPYFRQIGVGRDGRIWVLLSQPGEPIPEAELPEVRIVDGVAQPMLRHREAAVFDVFEPGGRYMGRVHMPPRTTWRAAMGDRVWTVVRDSVDLEQIVRFRLSAPGASR